MLTTEQVNFFNTFGYIVVRNSFSISEVTAISNTFDEVFSNHICVTCQGSPFGGDKRHYIVGFMESRPLFVDMAKDDRIYEPLSQLLDSGFIWVASDGNLYSGDTAWHSDKRTDPGYKQIKVAMYLDPVTPDTGCLRVIPGSHEQPFNDILRNQLLSNEGQTPIDQRPLESFGLSGVDIPCANLISNPGDVVFFRQEILHASFGGRTGRRMFATGVFDRPKTEAQIKMVKNLYLHHRKQADESDISAFFNSEEPRLREMNAGLKALGVE